MDRGEFEELLSSLTPYESTDTVNTYRNTVSISCPACDKPFDDLVVCKGTYDSLELSKVLDLCVTTVDEDVLLFTHQH